MRWTTQASAGLVAAALEGCSKNRRPCPETVAMSDRAKGDTINRGVDISAR